MYCTSSADILCHALVYCVLLCKPPPSQLGPLLDESLPIQPFIPMALIRSGVGGIRIEISFPGNLVVIDLILSGCFRASNASVFIPLRREIP